jgi:hypothetical protein
MNNRASLCLISMTIVAEIGLKPYLGITPPR